MVQPPIAVSTNTLAPVIAFLISDASKFITGQLLSVGNATVRGVPT